MSSTLEAFEEQRAGYEQYVREHWYDLADWEREQYTRFANWSADRKRVKRFVATPIVLPTARPAVLGESAVPVEKTSRLISLAYALAIVGTIFFPFILESAAVLLALVNLVCRRWEHAILQLAIALAVLGCAELGHSAATVVEPFVRNAFGM